MKQHFFDFLSLFTGLESSFSPVSSPLSEELSDEVVVGDAIVVDSESHRDWSSVTT